MSSKKTKPKDTPKKSMPDGSKYADDFKEILHWEWLYKEYMFTLKYFT